MRKRRHEKHYTAVVCSFTHWDRDWYSAFEVFRGRLVELMDALLDIYDADPDYKAFTMDGQTVPLEDYLAIRPENRARVEAAVRGGRLAVGPFYVLPDLYLVSGEALVRNLLVGRKSAQTFGRVMNAGYMPDPFGHPRTMPSILQGFGIDSYIASRGAPPEACRKGIVFRWQAPDGAEVTFTRQYPSYANLERWGVKSRYPDGHPDVDIEAAMARVASLVEEMEKEGANARTLLFNNGVDHQEAQSVVPALIREANRRFKHVTLRQGTYDDYARALKRENPKLQTFRGELRSGYQSHILDGVLSARMWIKQQNFACQKQLESVAEPLDALCGVLRAGTPSPYLEPAWKTLLKTHPHDDICGCSIDDVHRDNAHDFRHVYQMAGVSVQKQLQGLIERMPKRELADKKHLCIAFNPAPYERGAALRTHLNWGGDGIFEEAPEWRVCRADGTVVPSRILSGQPRAWGQYLNYWTFYDPAMPAMGYAVYYLEPGKPLPPPKELQARGATIENALLRATIKPNGTVDLFEKDTGRWFRGLNELEDVADVGDEYDFSPCAEPSSPVMSRTAKGKLGRACVDVGHAEVSAELTLRLPESVVQSRARRSKRLVSVPVRVVARLRPGMRRLELEVTLKNSARDHRLRALFPTGIRSSKVMASGHFDVIERPLDPGRGTRRHRQPVAPTQPMDEWVGVNGRGRGALVTTRGLPEYQGVRGKGGVSLAVTLLRCVGWLSRNDLVTRRNEGAGPMIATPEAQCLDTYTFDYAFIPWSGDVGESGALRWARDFGVLCDVFNAKREPNVIAARGGRLPTVASWVSLDAPAIVLSALKRPEKGRGLVVRLFNPSGKRARGTLTFGRKVKSVCRARMDETRLGPMKSRDCQVKLSLKAHEILTLIVTL